MKYQIGEPGRIAVARFEDGDDILKGLVDIAIKENIRAGVFYLVGGMKEGRFVVDPKTEQMPPVPDWREISESHEIVGIGTIFWDEKEPRVHFHGAYAKRDEVKAGCLRQNAKAFLVLEAIVMEIKGVSAQRELDPVSNMVLLKI
ncbi:MAG: DNA-binding protein [Nitrospirae bacterium]|nr:DNA-binding protein [Nitrospirota bacterium]